MDRLGGLSKLQWGGDHLDPLLWEGNCSIYWKTLLNGGGILSNLLLCGGVISALPESMVQEILSPPYFVSVPNGGISGVGS